MEFNEIYCTNCKKILGHYNTKFYNEERISELLKTTHVAHVRNGHEVFIKKVIKN